MFKLLVLKPISTHIYVHCLPRINFKTNSVCIYLQPVWSNTQTVTSQKDPEGYLYFLVVFLLNTLPVTSSDSSSLPNPGRNRSCR